MFFVLSKMKKLLVVVLLAKLLPFSHEFSAHFFKGEPCTFTPAPKGKTPECARSGATFCEFPTNYPSDLIHFLVIRNKYDTRSLVLDETKDNFNRGGYPYPAANYESKIPKEDSRGNLPEPIVIPKPKFPAALDNGQLNTYVPPNFDKNLNFSDGFPGYSDRVQSDGYIRYNFGDLSSFLGLTPSEKLKSLLNFKVNFWKRNGKFVKFLARLKRSEKERQFRRKVRESPFKTNSTEQEKRKVKRQIDEPETLCASTSYYIMPRAAMNKQGEWKYIVNMQNSNDKYTQLVKSETCLSDKCSALCELPLGYTSKCEQKYIQKRLVALDGQGSQLYTDIFWIPSCCVCTIKRNIET